ncbi:MAG: hypothetical protein FJ096_07100 [Deltaproteobacteria bacterium]|nr:hypothetical protein [Deltaproteobacteria bacterium]
MLGDGGPSLPSSGARHRAPRRLLAWVLGFFLIVGGGLALILHLTVDLRDRTHVFLGHVRAGRWAEAHAMTTPDFQARVPLEVMPGWVGETVPSARRSTGEWINGFVSVDDEYCMEVWLAGERLEDSSVFVIMHKHEGLWHIAEFTHTRLPRCEHE